MKRNTGKHFQRKGIKAMANIKDLMNAALKAEEMFELDELEEYAHINCPMCKNVNNKIESTMGRLGSATFYRCRYCGMDFTG